MYRKSKSINFRKIYIRFTYFIFYLVKVSPIARVTSYRAPNFDIHLYLQQMDSVMNFIPQLNVPSIVTGDFNIDLSKSGSESKLTKFMHYYGFR
jgi:hypothetical protein